MLVYNEYVNWTKNEKGIPKGVEVTNRAKLLGHSVEVNLKNYSFADYDYCETALQALESNLVTPRTLSISKQKKSASPCDYWTCGAIKNSALSHLFSEKMLTRER